MPILLRTGLYDIYTEGICDMWRETARSRLANCALLIDAYDHGGRIAKDMVGTFGEFRGGSRNDEGVSPLDWFDYCRTGKPCTNAAPGKVRYYGNVRGLQCAVREPKVAHNSINVKQSYLVVRGQGPVVVSWEL